MDTTSKRKRIDLTPVFIVDLVAKLETGDAGTNGFLRVMHRKRKTPGYVIIWRDPDVIV